MIARVEGVLLERGPTRVVVDVAGVGYELQIPLSTFTELPDQGKTVSLHVHTHAREGAVQLFGFASAGERAVFDLLLRASRVGPKLAQTILSGISATELLEVIRNGRVSVLQGVPGVGRKMAERILVELRDRAEPLAAILASRGALPAAGEPPRAAPAEGVHEEALSALLNLGYPKARAERVLSGAAEEAGPDATLEALVRAALRGLAR